MNDILQPGMHPDADQLSTFAEGAASAHEREAMLAHLAGCARCRRTVFLMQGKQEAHAPVAEAAKRWTWQWLMPVGLAGAALACGLAGIVYVRLHHATGEIAVNQAQVQTPMAPGNEAPAPAQPEKVPPQTEKRGHERARAKVAGASGLSGGAAGTVVQAQAPMGNAGGMAIEPSKTENAPPTAAAPPLAPRPMAELAESPQVPKEASVAAAPNFPAAKAKPGLRIEHDRGPEDGTSQVSGLVTDQTGAVVAGAAVTLRDQTGKTQQTTSGGDGSFNLAEVPPGQYELKVTAQGFQAFRQTMDLKPRDMAMLDTKLTVGAASETVTVQADSLAVQTDSNVVSTLTPEPANKVETRNRNFAALASVGLQAGMADLPGHKPAAMTVALGRRVLSLDDAGTLFVSRNGGRKWKPVKPLWTGKVAQIESANGEVSAKKAGTETAPAIFRLTTEDGAVWVSEDGIHWRAR